MSKPKIFIVDSNVVAQQSLAEMLSRHDYELFFSNSAEEAIRNFGNIMPDIVLTEILMPSMSGLELCRYLKSQPDWRHIPIILTTALCSSSDLMKGLAAGADHFLSKPIHGDHLRAYIKVLLRTKRHYDQLKATVGLREELAAMIVHDMRNPITTLQLNSQLLEQHVEGSESTKYVQRISSQARYLKQFAEDLLTISRSEDHELILQKHPTDVAALVQIACEDYMPSAELRRINLKLALPQQSPHMMLDAHLFRRLLDNLIENAFKFSPPGSTVAVSLTVAGTHPATGGAAKSLRLTVSDGGNGVELKYRDQIFEKYEIGRLKEQGVQQSGLGLAFCKLVAQAHDGRIYVVDNVPRGAQFVVEI